MKILAVDQSYTSSGYCVLDEVEMLDSGLITSSTNDDVFDRAVDIAKKLVDIAEQHKPNIIGLEGLAFGMRGNATRNLAGLQYTIVNAFRQKGYRTVIIAPNTVKKVATGKGNAKKEELLDKLPDNIRYHFVENIGAKKTRGLYDLSDAYWIGKSVFAELVKIPTQHPSIIEQ